MTAKSGSTLLSCAFHKPVIFFRVVSVAETENPDRDPRTQIAHTIIYSRNVFSTVMAGACVRTAALVMTYFAHEYSTACHFEFSKFTSFFFQILNCGHGSFNRTTGRGKYKFITYPGQTRSIFQEITPTWLHINGALLICIPDLTQ